MGHYEEDFNKEQTYLKTVYEKMGATEVKLSDFIQQATSQGMQTISKMTEDVRLDFSTYADNVDTLATIEMKNREIDQMNSRLVQSRVILDKVRRSLQEPYFGKVEVTFKDMGDQDVFYIGIHSYSEEDSLHKYVYDWRTPIAELFYNNELGASSYEVDGHTILVSIDNRRQFVVEKDKLLKLFDTSVAIQDDVLLEALEQDQAGLMQDITATIQKEQNQIIRDKGHKLILVNGVAGSGKSSTIMQRIAYLLYLYRGTLGSDSFFILSPNKGFVHYVSNVLPSLGEETPTNQTFLSFMQELVGVSLESQADYFERISQETVDAQTDYMRSLDFMRFVSDETMNQRLAAEEDFFISLKRRDKVIISSDKIRRLFNQTPVHLPLTQRIEATKQLIASYWTNVLTKRSKDVKVQDRVLSLPEDLQLRYFNQPIQTSDRQSIERYTLKYLKLQYQQVTRAIGRLGWLEPRRMVERLYAWYTDGETLIWPEQGQSMDLDLATLLAYVRHLYVSAYHFKGTYFLLVDEVQDYSPAQLVLLKRLFYKAELMFVGDDNQAIFNAYSHFDTIEEVFNDVPKQVTYRLLNSYRSQGAITQLFSQLALHPNEWQINAIRPYGEPAQLMQVDDDTAFIGLIESLRGQLVSQALVIITKSAVEAQHLHDLLGEHQGLRILSISLAKGLEFDNVVLYDVSQENYHTKRDKRILYTAASRAMKQLWVTYSGALSSFVPVELFEQVENTN